MVHATRRWPRVVAAGALALLVASAPACGASLHASLADDAVTPPPVIEVLREQRLAYQALGSSPHAAEVDDELAQVGGWLDRAELMAAVEEVDHARLALLTEAIEGQLTMIKTLYDRRDAERAVADRVKGGTR